MEDKIFLNKYCVSREQIAATGEFSSAPVTYTAKEIDSEKQVTIELIPVGPQKESEHERLEAEANAAKKLNHVNIAALYDFGVEDGHLVYVTEHLEGTVAEEWINLHGPLPVGPVLRIASQVVSALYAAISNQIVHSAVNPGNLVLVSGQTAEGEWPLVKVRNFVGGTSKSSDTGGPVAAFDKSLHYLSPEQIQKGIVDFRSETYSLGCTMWLLLTGVPPTVTPQEPTAVARATAGSKVRAIPKKVRRLLAQMLSANPEDRPHDPLELYRKLHDCLARVERSEAISRRFGVIPFSRRSDDIIVPRRRPLKTLALAALFLVLAALTALAVSGYLRHKRVVRSEKPFGVPIGVPSALPSTTPTSVDTRSAIASGARTAGNLPQARSAAKLPSTITTSTTPSDAITPPSTSTQSTSVITQSNQPPPAPPSGVELDKGSNAMPSASGPIQSTGQNQVAAAPPSQPAGADVAANPQVEQPPSVAPNNPAATAGQSSGTVAQHFIPKKPAPHEVRRAQPVQPAAPAPGEGPEEVAPGATAPSQSQDLSTQAGQSRDIETGTQPRVTTRPRAKSKRYAKQKRWIDSRTYAQRRSVHARFVGVTPDGMWVMRLPSNRIIVIPPPQSYR